MRLDRSVLKRLTRRLGWSVEVLAARAEVPSRQAYAAFFGDAVTPSVLERLAGVLGAAPDELLSRSEPVLLDAEKVQALTSGRTFKELLAAGGGTLSSGAIGRAQHGQPISRGVAIHLASVLNVPLDQLIRKEDSP